MVNREITEWFERLRSDAVVLSVTSDIYQSLVVLYAAGGDQNSAIWRERLPMLDTLSPTVVREYENYSAFFITDPWGVWLWPAKNAWSSRICPKAGTCRIH